MIKFNELRIDKSTGTPSLIVDVSVLNVSTYFDDVYIRRIIVINAKDYTPSLNPETDTVDYVFNLEIKNDRDLMKYGDYDNNHNIVTKRVKVSFTNNDLYVDPNTAQTATFDYNNDLYVVYVYTGTFDYDNFNFGSADRITWELPRVAEEVCCELSKTYDTGIVFDVCKIYSAIMQNIKEIDCNSCDIPLNFMNIYLQYMAFKYAIITCNYTDAILRFNKMFGRKYNTTISSNCGCNK